MITSKEQYEQFQAIAYCLTTRKYTPQEIEPYQRAIDCVLQEMKAWEEAHNEEAEGSNGPRASDEGDKPSS